MVVMIVEFEPYKILCSVPAQWWLYYRAENEFNFKKISLPYNLLKTFLETYGYETNNIDELKKFGISTQQIKHNIKL
jgi:hypothetical protein